MIERGLPIEPAGQVLSDPSGSPPLVDAVLWVQHLLLGTTATAIAVLAIAMVGFLALSGRIDLRRGATAIIGCFILFGAASIANAFVQMFASSERVTTAVAMPAPTAAISPPPPPPPSAYDPYAGASVDRR